MKILTTTQVFPSSAWPTHGVFVRERMSKVAQLHQVKAAIAMPFFPFSELLKKGYRPVAESCGVQAGIESEYFRYFNIPKFFKPFDGFFFAASAYNRVQSIQKKFDFDIIDAHFAYPDGVGAAILSAWFNRPFVVTLRGTIGKYAARRWERKQICWALEKAEKIISVCDYLKQKAVGLGISPNKVHVIPNGVDPIKFHPLNREIARKSINLPLNSKIIVSVGNIVERKGFHHLIISLSKIRNDYPDIKLLIVGGAGVEGDYTEKLHQLIHAYGLHDNVILTGAQPAEKINNYLNSADVFCLATHGEGWANVLMEALACGVPVVTTRVGGNAEIINTDEIGYLVDHPDPDLIAKALHKVLDKKWNRDYIISRVANQTWDHVATRVSNVFEDALISWEKSKKML